MYMLNPNVQLVLFRSRLHDPIYNHALKQVVDVAHLSIQVLYSSQVSVNHSTG